MTVQVNVRLPAEIVTDLDRWAADEGVERSVLLRDMITEGLTARREGRAAFDRSKPLSLGDLAAMKSILAEGLMEIHRIATDWAKHLGEMRRQERDDQLKLTQARAEFISGIPDRISASLNPIREEMDVMIERIDRQPRLDAIDAKQQAHTEALMANTAAIERLEREPRTHNTYDLGLGEWNGKAWSLVLGVLWVMSVALFFGLAIILPPGALAVRSANMLLGGGDQAVCRLVDYRHGTDSCETRVNGHKVGVTLDVPTPKQGGKR